MNKVAWARGDQAKLAKNAGITRQKLNDFLKGRRTPSPECAERLEAEASALGYTIYLTDWLFPLRTTNPLFR